MRNRTLFIIITICAFGIAGCTKGFLDRTPETNISDGEFWKTGNDLKLYANNWYSVFPSYGGFGNIGIYGLDADNGSDNMISMGYNNAMNSENTIPASNGGWGISDWNNLRNINYFLANYTKSTESFDNIKPYVGEAFFFRAWFYFDKLKRFGNLPWLSAPLDPQSGQLFDARLARNVIVDSLMNDLDKAVEYLPAKSVAQVSRINKQIAQLFQARIALFEGTWEKYHAGTPFGVTGSDGSKYLQKAAAVTDALLAASGGYALETLNPAGNMEYWQLFNRSNYSASTEVMFWRQYIVGVNGGHNWHRYTTSGAGRGLTKDLVDAYLCTDGNPIASSPLYQGDNTLLSVVANRDPRLAQTMYVNDGKHYITNSGPPGVPDVIFQAPSLSGASEGKCATGYQVFKGHNPLAAQQISEQGTTGQIIFRFAEALLINAEAKAELGTLTQAVADATINKLRSRVGMPALNVAVIPADPNKEFPALSALINEVRRERRVELACEGYRRDDLQRWAAMGLKITGLKPKGAKKAQWVGIVPAGDLNGYPVDDNGYIELYKNVPAMSTGYKFKVNRDYLQPLPTSELTLNPKLSPQNPGW